MNDDAVAVGIETPPLRHWYVRTGSPVATTLNVVLLPTHALRSDGGVPIIGELQIASVAVSCPPNPLPRDVTSKV